MNNTAVLKIDSKTLIVDAILLGFMLIVPALSHLVGLPLRAIEPMRMALLAGMLLVNDRRNAYLLAVLLPVVSTLMTGFPAGAKCMLMVVEMLANVAIFSLLNHRLNVWASMAIAIVLSKAVYYGLKVLVFGSLVMTTPWYTQLLVVLGFSIAYAVFYANKDKSLTE